MTCKIYASIDIQLNQLTVIACLIHEQLYLIKIQKTRDQKLLNAW